MDIPNLDQFCGKIKLLDINEDKYTSFLSYKKDNECSSDQCKDRNEKLKDKIEGFTLLNKTILNIERELKEHNQNIFNLKKIINKVSRETLEYTKASQRNKISNNSMLFLDDRRFRSFSKAIRQTEVSMEYVSLLKKLEAMIEKLNQQEITPGYGVSSLEFEQLKLRYIPLTKVLKNQAIRKLHDYFQTAISSDNIRYQLKLTQNKSIIRFLDEAEPRLSRATQQLFCVVYRAYLVSSTTSIFNHCKNKFNVLQAGKLNAVLDLTSSFFFNSDFNEVLKFHFEYNREASDDNYSIQFSIQEFISSYLSRKAYFSIDNVNYDFRSIYKNNFIMLENIFLCVFHVILMILEESLTSILSLLSNDDFKSNLLNTLTKFLSMCFTKVLKLVESVQLNSYFLIYKTCQLLLPNNNKCINSLLTPFKQNILLAYLNELEIGIVEFGSSTFSEQQSLAIDIVCFYSACNDDKNLATRKTKINALLIKTIQVPVDVSSVEKPRLVQSINSLTVILQKAEDNHVELPFLLLQFDTFIQTFIELELDCVLPSMNTFINKVESSGDIEPSEGRAQIILFNKRWLDFISILKISIETSFSLMHEKILKTCLSHFLVFVARLTRCVHSLEQKEDSLIPLKTILQKLNSV